MFSFRRTSCRLCESAELELIYPVGPVALSDQYSVTRVEALAVPKVPVDVYVCNECQHVQQLDVVNPELLWKNLLYESGKSLMARQHMKVTAEQLVVACDLKADDVVVDVGSNDGTFLAEFKKFGMQTQGIDPATQLAEKANSDGIPTLAQSLNSDTASLIIEKYKNVSLISAFNVFAHVDDLSGFLSHIRSMMQKETWFVFEAQYLVDILKKNLIATFFHEHLSHHSLAPLLPFFKKHGLSLVDVWQSEMQHGSVIGFVRLGDEYKQSPQLESLLIQETSDLRQIAVQFQAMSRATKASGQWVRDSLISWHKSTGFENVAYGAARSLPTLMRQLNLESLFSRVIDSNERKIGKFESGDGLEVVSVEAVERQEIGSASIFAWVQNRHIVERNKEYLSRGGAILTLCPAVEIHTREQIRTLSPI